MRRTPFGLGLLVVRGAGETLYRLANHEKPG